MVILCKGVASTASAGRCRASKRDAANAIAVAMCVQSVHTKNLYLQSVLVACAAATSSADVCGLPGLPAQQLC